MPVRCAPPLALASLLLAACSAEPAPPPLPDPTPPADTAGPGPAVVAVEPADRATDVELGVAIEARFSRDLDPATVNPATFRVAHGHFDVAGTVEYVPARRLARFLPAEPFQRRGEYVATLTADVTDRDGVPLAAPVTWRFTAAESGWGGRERLHGDAFGRHTPVLVPSADGTIAVLAIGGTLATGGGIWDTRLYPDVGLSWTDPVKLPPLAHPVGPVVAAGGPGATLAVARMIDDGPVYRLGVQVYRPMAGGWGPFEPVAATARGFAIDARLVIDATGAITVVYSKQEIRDTPKSLWASRRSPAGTWDAPVLLEHDDGPSPLAGGTVWHDATLPALVVDGDGAVTAAWSQRGPDDTVRVWASRYTDAAGWSPPEALSDHSSSYVELGVDRAGVVTAVWRTVRQPADVERHVVRRFEGGGWGPPVDVIRGAWQERRMLVDPTGAITLVWTATDGFGWRLWGRRFVTATGWDEPVLLDESDVLADPPLTPGPELAADDHGRVHLLYRRLLRRGMELASRRYRPGLGWGAATPVASTTIRNGLGAYQLAARADGGAVAVWADRAAGIDAGGRQVVAMYCGTLGF